MILCLGALYFSFTELQSSTISALLGKCMSFSDKQSIPEYLLDVVY